MELSVIITGSTGLVGEGVLKECLDYPAVKEVLVINRRPSGFTHPKLSELIIKDFFNLEEVKSQISGYNSCFFCAGKSSSGMKEPEYSKVTYELTMHFAETLLTVNPEMDFCFVSGQLTDSTEKGKIMWARIKGKTENALMKLPFKHMYAFRPGFMRPTKGQKNVKGYYKIIAFVFPLLVYLFPEHGNTLKELGKAMINTLLKGYPKQVLEVKDIKLLASQQPQPNDC